jgi:hypothetical protein
MQADHFRSSLWESTELNCPVILFSSHTRGKTVENRSERWLCSIGQESHKNVTKRTHNRMRRLERIEPTSTAIRDGRRNLGSLQNILPSRISAESLLGHDDHIARPHLSRFDSTAE